MMGSRDVQWASKIFIAVVVSSVMIGIVAAQVQPVQNRARLRNQGGVPLKEAKPKAGDPLLKGDGGNIKAKANVRADGTYHYIFKLHSFDGSPLAASYYPSKLGSSAPILMLIHEANRSRKDFEEPVEGLKGLGLAEYLQQEGYAVFSMDLRGQGQNPRRPLTVGDRPLLVTDLQAAYMFLIDRHNRGDFNVAKLGIIAVGEGANLTAAWAYQPAAAISTDGRPSDINALVLISPYPSGSGYMLSRILPSLVTRTSVALLAGNKDNASKDAVESVRKLVERERLNKVELFPLSLHGYKLMRLEPKLLPIVTRFLEPVLKLRPIDWEPRYNLIPVTVSEIQSIAHAQTGEKPAAKNGQAKPAEAAKLKAADKAAKPAPANENDKVPD